MKYVRLKHFYLIEKITNNVKENMEKFLSIKSKMEANPPDYTVIIPLLKQIIIYNILLLNIIKNM